MAKKSKKVGDLLEITTTGDDVIVTLTREEIVGKIAEAQTVVDHLSLDSAAAELDVQYWKDELAVYDA